LITAESLGVEPFSMMMVSGAAEGMQRSLQRHLLGCGKIHRDGLFSVARDEVPAVWGKRHAPVLHGKILAGEALVVEQFPDGVNGEAFSAVDHVPAFDVIDRKIAARVLKGIDRAIHALEAADVFRIRGKGASEAAAFVDEFVDGEAVLAFDIPIFHAETVREKNHVL
jgi:hypothetical protein